MKKKYEVTLFILGLPYNEYNSRVVEFEANSQEEAEAKAYNKYVSDGWGVYSSREVREELSETQVEEAVKRIDYLIGLIVTDNIDRNSIVDEIKEDVLCDIEECADWLSLEKDEWCEADIDIAVARVLKERILG